MANSDVKEIDQSLEQQQDTNALGCNTNITAVDSGMVAFQGEVNFNSNIALELEEDQQRIQEFSLTEPNPQQDVPSSHGLCQTLILKQQSDPNSAANVQEQHINVDSNESLVHAESTQIATDKSTLNTDDFAKCMQGTEIRLTPESAAPLTQTLKFGPDNTDMPNYSQFSCHERIEEDVATEQVSTAVVNVVTEPGSVEQITLSSEITRSSSAVEEFGQDSAEMLVTGENIVLICNDDRYKLTTQSVPTFVIGCSSEFHQDSDDNYLRGCKWSPDGRYVVTNSNDNCLRIFNPPLQNCSVNAEDEMSPSVKMKESGQIYDFVWHPKMSEIQPDFCRIASTCSGIPIHLWDCNNGKIVANYRAYDQYDEITAAYSLSFSPDGSKIYAGYNKTIRVFDTEYPVRSCKTIKTFNSQKRDGQPGIISCFAHSPNGSGLYIAGSYSRHIGIYDSACDKLVCLMQGQHGGVTHVMLSPDGTKLYSGGRKDAEILCWDVRNMGKILFSVLRDVKTNQRIYFDLSRSGRYLLSGNNDGTIAFWDTIGPAEDINGEMFLKPCSQFQAHQDCVNGVSFNHHHDMIATSSGQRHFESFGDYDSDESCEDENMEVTEKHDFSLKVWKIPLMT